MPILSQRSRMQKDFEPPIFFEKDPDDPLVTYMGYRWYVPYRNLRYASQNARNYSAWILALKENRETAKFLFGLLIWSLWIDDFIEPDCIIAMPPSKSYFECPDYPLAQVASDFALLYSTLPMELVQLLIRTRTVPRCRTGSVARSVEFQKSSMALASRHRTEAINNYLIIDDVTTSGSHFKAASQLIRESNPRAKITCLAFGKTTDTRYVRFPDQPAFPLLDTATNDDILELFDYI